MVDYVGFIFLDELVEKGEKECIFNIPCDERTHRYISGESFI
jgi:ABC-type phosphate transport system ATPase subunit